MAGQPPPPLDERGRSIHSGTTSEQANAVQRRAVRRLDRERRIARGVRVADEHRHGEKQRATGARRRGRLLAHPPEHRPIGRRHRRGRILDQRTHDAVRAPRHDEHRRAQERERRSSHGSSSHASATTLLSVRIIVRVERDRSPVSYATYRMGLASLMMARLNGSLSRGAASVAGRPMRA